MRNTICTGVIFMFCSVSAWAQCRATPPSSSAQIFKASSSGPTANFTVADRGAITFDTEGGPGSAMVGYARVQTNSGTTPSAYLTFQNRLNGVLVGQASVGATAPVGSGRIYAEVGGPVNTGIAIANPNSTAATITYFFTDAAGQNSASANFTLGANAQTAKFLTEAPFNSASSFNGTMTFTSSVPIAVIALRGYINERGEFLITTLPVTSLSASGGATSYLPHFADGGGWSTQVVLVNSSDSPTTGNVQFFSQGTGGVTGTAGTPLTLTVEGQAAAIFPYSIPARSSVRLRTAGLGSGPIAVGSVRVASSSGTPATALAIFTYRTNGVTVSEAGVPSVTPSTAFRMYEYDCGDYRGQIQTGIAITNPGGAATTVTVELTELWGASAGMTTTLNVPGNGQVAKFMMELFPNLPYPFHGVARISSPSAIAVTALRGDYNSRNDFLITTALPTSESASANAGEVIFPHLVNLGGYTTEFVLYSGVAGQTSSGVMSFYTQSGLPLSLNLQ
jgi:hypothetical protein